LADFELDENINMLHRVIIISGLRSAVNMTAAKPKDGIINVK